MRKGRDGKEEKKRKEEEEKNDVFSGHYVIASSLPPERLRPNDDRWNAARSCQWKKSKMAARGPKNGRQGLERCLPLGFGALPSTFAK